MLKHLNDDARAPKRVVIMGAAGFVGGAVSACLRRAGVPVLELGRSEVDLLDANAAQTLASLLKPGDAFVAASARAPVKNADMLVENMIMVRSILTALRESEVAHVVNVSSDAIYADSNEPLHEGSTTAPGSLHGAMHFARELMFEAEVKAPLAHVRPTLIYGPADPHNGYGPNKFRRLAAQGRDIELFGNGEERRDHVYIADVAELITRVLYRRSTGALNVATGEVHPFRDIAEHVIRLAGRPVAIVNRPRSGPMPHNGYRAFDCAGTRAAFPDFRYVKLEEGLARAAREEASGEPPHG